MSQVQVEQFFPFDQGAGLSATQPRWRSMARLWYGSGVVPNFPPTPPNQFSAALAGGVLTVQPGAAWIDGFYGESDSAKRLTIVGNGMVVARMDPTGRQVILIFVAGQTVPTQNLTGIYEVPLYTISGTTLTDVRQFANAIPGRAAGGRIYRVTGYPTSTTFVDFGFDSPTPRPPNFSGGTFTCPYAADYLVTCQAGFLATAANEWYAVQIVQNATGITQSSSAVTVGGGYGVLARCSDVVPCKTGDTLKMQHRCSTTGLQGYVGQSVAYMTVRALT